MKIVAVDGRSWSPEVLHDAIKTAAKSTAPLEMLVENSGFNQSHKLDYHAGERYPHLERDAAKPDVLSEIIKARRANSIAGMR
jgi:hypothetical protein